MTGRRNGSEAGLMACGRVWRRARRIERVMTQGGLSPVAVGILALQALIFTTTIRITVS